MKLRILIVLFVLLLPVSSQADPVRLVDTGPGPSGFPGYSLYSGQWLAAEFTLGESSILTSLQGWIHASGGGWLGVSIYEGGGDLPGTLLLHTYQTVSAGEADWRGVNVAWVLNPGTYWVGFVVPSSGGMSGMMPYPVPNPLPRGAAAHSDSGFNWFSDPGAEGIGVRIWGEAFEPTPPVPEPASVLLLGTGLAALAARRRFRLR